MIYDLDVEGVMMGSRMTKSQVIAKFGDNIAKLSVLAPVNNGKGQYTLWCYEDFLMVINVDDRNVLGTK